MWCRLTNSHGPFAANSPPLRKPHVPDTPNGNVRRTPRTVRVRSSFDQPPQPAHEAGLASDYCQYASAFPSIAGRCYTPRIASLPSRLSPPYATPSHGHILGTWEHQPRAYPSQARRAQWSDGKASPGSHRLQIQGTYSARARPGSASSRTAGIGWDTRNNRIVHRRRLVAHRLRTGRRPFAVGAAWSPRFGC